MERTFDVYETYDHEDDYPGLDAEGAVGRLAAALTYKTVNNGNIRANDDQFAGLRDHIRSSFPHVMGLASFETIGRSVLTSLEGCDSSLDPVLLLAHQDVVPADGGSWTHDPFGGHVDETHVWGRGALDIKGMLMAELEALEMLLASGSRPTRGVFLAFGDDEETMSSGAVEVARELSSRGRRFAFVLDEGTTTIEPATAYGAPNTPMQGICLSQKGFLNLGLTVRGHGGHSSNPFGGTSLERLCVAIARLSEARPAPELSPIVAGAFAELAPHISEEPFASLVDDIEGNRAAIAEAAEKVRQLFPLVSTTMAVDMLNAGTAANVMPHDSSAVLNFRLLPGVTLDDVLTHVRSAIDDSLVEVEVIHHTPAGRPDKAEGLGYESLKQTLEHYYKGVAFVPTIMCAGADAMRYEAVTDCIMRVLPYAPTPKEEQTGLHGVDERISKRTYLQGVRVLARLLEKTCFSPWCSSADSPCCQ